jgi:hypothetical protein
MLRYADAFTAGVMSFDEIETWNGRTDRFDWKLIGKQEMLIPYNGNKLLQPKTDAEVLGKAYLNPDHALGASPCLGGGGDAARGPAPSGAEEPLLLRRGHWNCVLGDRGTPMASCGRLCGRRPSSRRTCRGR